MTREEAIKIVKNIYQTDKEKEALDVLIPELAESEDERIRKWLVELVENQEPKMFIEVKKMNVFSWLEKQKDAIGAARQQGYEEGMEDGASMVENAQKEQKAAEWSEEDEEFFRLLHAGLYAMKVKIGRDEYDKAVERLKSLRPSWKPSEEQMEALKRASINEYIPAKQFDILVSLYEQLKKL